MVNQLIEPIKPDNLVEGAPLEEFKVTVVLSNPRITPSGPLLRIAACSQLMWALADVVGLFSINLGP
ncbi:MAG: hypothetical protein ACREFP_25200, partial [Acetobacteraceae bacterium]